MGLRIRVEGWDMGQETRDMGHRTWDMGHGTRDMGATDVAAGCRRTGLVVLGPPGDPELEGCRHSLGPDAVLDAVTLAQRFPGLRPRPGEVALWDSSGGVLLADRALRAVQVGAAAGTGMGDTEGVPSPSLHPILPTQDAFRRCGGTVRDGEKVLRIDPGAVITVTTAAGLYRAPRLIIAAGAWTNAVVAPLGLRLPLQVRAGGRRWWHGHGHV